MGSRSRPPYTRHPTVSGSRLRGLRLCDATSRAGLASKKRIQYCSKDGICTKGAIYVTGMGSQSDGKRGKGKIGAARLALTLISVATIVLTTGSAVFGYLVIKYSLYRSTFDDALTTFAVALGIAWLCSGCALLIARWYLPVVIVTLAALGTWWGMYYAVFLIVAASYTPHVPVLTIYDPIPPLPILPALLTGLLLVALNGCAIYWVRRFILSLGPRLSQST